jgi:hypothetical protein
MWGTNWGLMIWGGLTAVPAIGFWGAVMLAALLGVMGVRRLRGRSRVIGAGTLLLVLLLPISARAVPFTFTNGTVADATQVNANFAAVAAQAGIGPTASSTLVDLVENSPCVAGAGTGVQLDNVVDSTGVRHAFSVGAGQTLVLTTVNVQIALGVGMAGHGIGVRLARASASTFNPIEGVDVTLDANGTGRVTVPLGNGSPFGPGTVLCVSGQDINTAASVSAGAAAHGFVTTL